MPSHETFTISPIRTIVKRYLALSEISIDPFARNNEWANYTNDLNPETTAKYHLEAFKFLEYLRNDNIKADLILFDPPYSMGQAKECYENFGSGNFTQEHAQNAGNWAKEKRIINDILLPNGIFIHCGWHSNGLGKQYNTRIEEILLVAHGRSHNDTIVTVERKLGHQEALF